MKIKRSGEKFRKIMDSAKSTTPPPPLPPPPRKNVKSVTRDEIDRYWRMKKMIEEDHLFAALKAAARIKAQSLSEEDYRRFEESLKDENNKEMQVGIKDWWTKSKYAYLNQPATKSMVDNDDDASKGPTNTHTPQKACSCYHVTSHSMATSFGVF